MSRQLRKERIVTHRRKQQDCLFSTKQIRRFLIRNKTSPIGPGKVTVAIDSTFGLSILIKLGPKTPMSKEGIGLGAYFLKEPVMAICMLEPLEKVDTRILQVIYDVCSIWKDLKVFPIVDAAISYSTAITISDTWTILPEIRNFLKDTLKGNRHTKIPEF